jgi:hypothetical protein
VRHDGTVCLHGHPLTISEEQKQAAIELTRMVADEHTSADDIRAKVAHIRGRISKTLQPMQGGELYLMPGGEEWILLRSPSPEHTRAVEIALGRIVAGGLHLSDLVTLVRSINDHITGLSVDLPADLVLPW